MDLTWPPGQPAGVGRTRDKTNVEEEPGHASGRLSDKQENFKKEILTNNLGSADASSFEVCYIFKQY